MNPERHVVPAAVRGFVAVLCAIVLIASDTFASVPFPDQATGASADQTSAVSPEQLDSLVAPIALYPDPLLAQVLAASTYPLEIIQLQQWLGKNKGLKDKALADAVEKQPWDASVQALAALPDLAKRLADDIQWTTDLGNAFLAQEGAVMDAVQRMRKKAQESGNLKSTEQQSVKSEVVEGKTVVVIQQANPQVVYVPTYNPQVVWGAPMYPYPPIYYPPPGYYAAGMAVAFGVGVAMGSWWGGGGWGWGCGWGGNNITINNNNNFIRNSNINAGNIGNGNRGNLGGNGNRWQHRPEHRGGAPYSDRATADRFGGAARGDSLANRQSNARQQVGRQGGNLPSNRAGGAGVSDRVGGGNGNRTGGGVGDRAGAGGGVSNRASGAGPNNRPGGAGGNNRTGAGGADRVGNRDVSRGTGSGDRSAFGSSQGFNGSSARASDNRGAASAQSRGGGARSGGGAMSGGGTRGGGGARSGGGGRGGGGRRR